MQTYAAAAATETAANTAMPATDEPVSAGASTVVSGTVAGGVIGAVKAEPANIVNVDADVNVKADFAGSFAGRISAPKALSVNGSVVRSEVEGAKVASGVIAQISSENAGDAFDKLNRNFVTETVITADIKGDDVKALVIGEVSEAVAVERTVVSP